MEFLRATADGVAHVVAEGQAGADLVYLAQGVCLHALGAERIVEIEVQAVPLIEIAGTALVPPGQVAWNPKSPDGVLLPALTTPS
jgi:hypothetical protein